MLSLILCKLEWAHGKVERKERKNYVDSILGDRSISFSFFLIRRLLFLPVFLLLGCLKEIIISNLDKKSITVPVVRTHLSIAVKYILSFIFILFALKSKGLRQANIVGFDKNVNDATATDNNNSGSKYSSNRWNRQKSKSFLLFVEKSNKYWFYLPKLYFLLYPAVINKWQSGSSGFIQVVSL